MSDNQSMSVDPGAVIQVQNAKISNLTQTTVLLEAKILELQTEVDRLNTELVKNVNEDITAESEE